MRRPKPPEDRLKEHVLAIHFSFKHWKRTKKTGAKDPNWPDGTNLNLIRNHIIYDQMQARELCEAMKVKCPKEVRLKLPRLVSENYMVKAVKAVKKGRGKKK